MQDVVIETSRILTKRNGVIAIRRRIRLDRINTVGIRDVAGLIRYAVKEGLIELAYLPETSRSRNARRGYIQRSPII